MVAVLGPISHPLFANDRRLYVVYALPFMLGRTAAQFAYNTGSSFVGACFVGLVAAKVWAHRGNIRRYKRILATGLMDLERQFVEGGFSILK